jgi:dTMP kinase
MIEGHLVVLEGIDGAGTTTQTELLARALGRRGLAVHATREPSDGPIGALLRQVLSGRMVVPGDHGPRAPGWSTMALLFAADRLDHLQAEILPNLRDGVTVLCDRYVASSVAYQGLTEGDPSVVDWVLAVNRHARVPDLTLVLDVSPEEAARRRARRSGRPELYEEESLQQRLALFYKDIDKHFPGHRLRHLDGHLPVEALHQEVLRAVDELRARG